MDKNSLNKSNFKRKFSSKFSTIKQYFIYTGKTKLYVITKVYIEHKIIK